MPQSPPLPKVDYKACPLECCTFRAWKVTRKSRVFSSWRESRRRPTGWLQPGAKVAGLTGVHLTFRPDKLRMLRNIPELKLRKGDGVLRLMYQGEGYAQYWSNGNYFPSLLFIGDDTIETIQEGRREWWVQVRMPDGNKGWVLVQDDNFDGMDSCG